MNKIEIIFWAQRFVSICKEFNLQLDYSIASLERIENYLASNFKDSNPKKNSIFYEDAEGKTFFLGAYLGEVIRKNGRGIKWNTKGIESPYKISLEVPGGGTAFVINKAFKRVNHGEEDDMHHFARIMLNKYMQFEGDIPGDFYDEDDLRIEKYGENPVVMYSKGIAKNGGIVDHIYHEDGLWQFSVVQENNSESDYMYLDEVKALHPEFADLLIASKKMRIVRQNDGTYRKQKEHTGIFYDSHTIPTYQGDMKLDILQWTKFNSSKVVKPTLFLIAGILLTIYVHWLFGLSVLLALIYSFLFWNWSFNLFKGGDVNPGKVISLNPVLVAISSDMRKYDGDYPILKIIETKLPPEDLVLDKVIPTIAMYADNPHGYPFWAEFRPVPVIHGYANRDHINQILSDFSTHDLDNLHDYVEKAGTKEVGIYKIDEETSNWRDYKHVDISKGLRMDKPDEAQK